ncbi:hypothetical protein DDE82_008197 [Stemphylium lycopersici]|nr:hypothetical protein DDE82_008197 [Stemphylium lycopersici]
MAVTASTGSTPMIEDDIVQCLSDLNYWICLMGFKKDSKHSKHAEIARLSAPANGTPKTEQKPSRLRSIFKPRSSSASFSGSTTSTKKSPTTDTGPLALPTVKHGFKQIGLLPSERPSYTLGQLAPWEKQISEEAIDVNIRKDVQESEIATAAPCADAKPKEAEGRGDKSFAPWSQKGQPEDLWSPWHSNTSLPAANSTSHPKITTSQNRGSIFGNSQPRLNRAPSQKSYELLERSLKGSREDVEQVSDGPITGHLFGQNTNGFNDAVGLTNDPSLLGCAHEGSSRGLFANIASGDQGYQLAKCFRDYVDTKVAEAFAQQIKKESAKDLMKKQRAAVQVNFNMRKANVGTSAKVAKPVSYGAALDMFSRESVLGPYTISNSRVAQVAQPAITAINAIFILGATLLGPRTLLLALWRAIIGLGAYAILVLYLGGTKHLEHDVLLAPIFFARMSLYCACKKVLGELRVVLVSIIIESLQGLEDSGAADRE